MNINSTKTVADGTLPLLVTLVLARKQALYHWEHCSGEHKHKWAMVCARLDERITIGEKVLKNHLDLLAFHINWEIVG